MKESLINMGLTKLQRQRLVMRKRLLAEFANSRTYKEILKPKMEKIKAVFNDSIKEPEDEFEAVKHSIKHITTNKVIDSLISLVEGAEKFINKKQ